MMNIELPLELDAKYGTDEDKIIVFPRSEFVDDEKYKEMSAAEYVKEKCESEEVKARLDKNSSMRTASIMRLLRS